MYWCRGLLVLSLFVFSSVLTGCGYHKTISKESLSDGSRGGDLSNQGAKDIFGQIQAGDLKAVKDKIESGEDLNAVNSKGQTLVMYAFLWAKKDVLFYLLESGADLDLRDSEGKNLEDYGADNEELYEQVLAFLQKDQIQKDFFEMVLLANPDRVKELLDLGADPNMRYEEDEATPLIRSVQLADRKDRKTYRKFQMIIRHLLQQDNSKKPVYGTEINLRDSNGNTALFYAQEKNDRGLVRALKAAKAEL